VDETNQRTWFGRNWKWVLPVGCLGPLTLLILGCAGIFGIIMGSMKHSWAYSEGLALARQNTEVVAVMGEPIETGFLTSGSINVSGSSGNADLAIPINGPKSKGTLYVVAHKQVGEWMFDNADVEIDGQQKRINLLPQGKPSQQPAR
jgi:hypothetical protein